ncbi:MAG: 2,3-bisphosphoglycerate-independent phosphoglycerate mutase [Candidatus Eremiobacteraeota bacterium]|nr:2,3-bisphosphoglycerate-independent phosphoglycerate mutase [Candidatus Eremiobacteraeota bacterium]MDQ6933346.1 2,3-bisphosphoglycerate-independent phosphoglycerate mutase [Candidatus Eremiobacteraeota bacterium]
MTKQPLVLAILDGWGCSDNTYGNAIAAADLPHYRKFLELYPWTTLEASGEAVGLPKGVMGNSEVGHTNLGSGRVVPQGLVVINDEIAAGTFESNSTLQNCFARLRDSGGTLHLMGLLSEGGVHSSLAHVVALVDAAAKAKVPFAIHAFTDGRDTPPQSARGYIMQLEAKLKSVERSGAIATVIGRFYAMDRDKRWERTQTAYDALVYGSAANVASTALEAVVRAYSRGETDEFITPTIVGAARTVRDGDAIVFFNFRPDRARQLTLAFTREGFSEFPLKALHDVHFASMTKYEEDFGNPVLFGPRPQYDTFGEILAGAGLTQLRLAETEKYAHVTYFFNGGREEVFAGEDRELIASDRSIPTYDLAPQMRAREITDFAIADIVAVKHDVIIMNYANADMIGHTGQWKPTIESLEVLDSNLDRLSRAVLAVDGILAITADHGNAEEKIDADGNPLTAHTSNPVPLILISREPLGSLLPGGCLADVAPTLLSLLKLPIPHRMTGRKLLMRATAVA